MMKTKRYQRAFMVACTLMLALHISGQQTLHPGLQPEFSGLRDVRFMDANTWYIQVDTELWVTKDAGKTWQPIFSNKDLDHGSLNYSFSLRPSGGIIVCSAKGIFKSDQQKPSRIGDIPEGFGIHKCLFETDQVGWLVGYRFDKDKPVTQGALAKTEDGGITWKPVPLPSPTAEEEEENWDLRDIAFVDKLHGIIAGKATILVTSDGGVTWKPLKTQGYFYDSVRVSGRLAWVTERESDSILISYNGGTSWVARQVPTPYGTWPAKIVFLDTSNALLGNGNHLYRTSDTAKRWVRQKTCGLSFHELSMFENMIVSFVDTEAGEMAIRSHNFGLDWRDQFDRPFRLDAWCKTFSPRAGGLSSAQLNECATHKAWPDYPAMARIARVSGKVTIEVEINSRGEVEGTRLISGSPALASAALDAAKRWTFDLGKCGPGRSSFGLLDFVFK